MKLIEGFELRPLKRTDAASLAHHANNRKIWRNLRDQFPFPYTDKDAQRWIAATKESNVDHAFAIATPQEAIGTVGIQVQQDVYRRGAEIGFWLGEAYWGRGIATLAVNRASEWAFATLEIDRLQAFAFGWNPASARVLEKSGYQREGCLRNSVFKDNQLIDQWLYARLRGTK